MMVTALRFQVEQHLATEACLEDPGMRGNPGLASLPEAHFTVDKNKAPSGALLLRVLAKGNRRILIGNRLHL